MRRKGLPLEEAPIREDVRKFGGDKEEHNVAGEDQDPLEEEAGGGDSNNASEERADTGGRGEAGGHRGAATPGAPLGPLRFGGPQNERQRAVVAAFKHAWQVRTNTQSKGHPHPGLPNLRLGT